MKHSRPVRILIVLSALALAACSGPNDPGVGGVTRGEADALNTAAARLDMPSVQPETGPADNDQAAAR